MSDGTTNESVQIQISGDSEQISFVVLADGTQQMVFTGVDITFGETFKTAIAYAQDDFSVYLNGTQIGTDNSGDVPTGLSKIIFGRGNDTQLFEGEAKQALLFKTRLTNAELAALTTI